MSLRSMKTLEITKEQFDEFKRLQVKKRWDWPASFSTNIRGAIWPFVTNGRTPLEDRNDVRGVSPLLDRVADIYTALREEGGRFFIGWKGAFWSAQDGDKPIILWDFGQDAPARNRPKTLAELRATQAKRRL